MIKCDSYFLISFSFDETYQLKYFFQFKLFNQPEYITMIVKVLIKSFNFIRILLYKLPPAMNGHLARIYKDWGAKGRKDLCTI